MFAQHYAVFPFASCIDVFDEPLYCRGHVIYRRKARRDETIFFPLPDNIKGTLVVQREEKGYEGPRKILYLSGNIFVHTDTFNMFYVNVGIISRYCIELARI